MSPNQLIPSQPYTLSYFITDHTDNNTYYVRAVVYDATTGDILDTQNLSSLANKPHLFTKRTNAPGDPSGHGRRIVVVATAYEDSGYVTKSSLYQEQSENYIIIKDNAGLLGGGGGYIDYNIIKEIFDTAFVPVVKAWSEALALIKAMSVAIDKIPTEKPELQPLKDSLQALHEAVSVLPKTNTDIEPLKTLVEKAITAVNDKEVTEKTDLTPVIEALKAIDEQMGTHHSENMTKMTPLVQALSESLPALLDKNIKQAIAKQKFTLEPVGLNVEAKTEDKTAPKKSEKAPAVPFDIRTLTGQPTTP